MRRAARLGTIAALVVCGELLASPLVPKLHRLAGLLQGPVQSRVPAHFLANATRRIVIVTAEPPETGMRRSVLRIGIAVIVLTINELSHNVRSR